MESEHLDLVALKLPLRTVAVLRTPPGQRTALVLSLREASEGVTGLGK